MQPAEKDNMANKATSINHSFSNPLLHCIGEIERSHDDCSEASTVASLSPKMSISLGSPTSTVASSVNVDSPSRSDFKRAADSMEKRRSTPDMPGSWIEGKNCSAPAVTVTRRMSKGTSVDLKSAEPSKRCAPSSSPSRAQEISYFSAKALPPLPHSLISTTSNSSSCSSCSSLNHGVAKAIRGNVADSMPASESSSTTTTLTSLTWDGGHLNMKRPLSIVSLHESIVSSDSGRSRSLSLLHDGSTPDLLMIRPPHTPVIVYQANHGSMPMFARGSVSSAPNVPTKKAFADSHQLRSNPSKDSLKTLFKRRGGAIGRLFTARSFHSAHCPEPKSA
jgi:hypothetical protein